MPHGGIHFAVNRPLGSICPAVPALFMNLIDPAFTYASFGFEEAGNQYQCSKQNSGPASLMDIYDACPYKKCPQQPTQQPAEPGDQFFIFIQCRSFLMYAVKLAIARPGHCDKDHSSDAGYATVRLSINDILYVESEGNCLCKSNIIPMARNRRQNLQQGR